jgi:6-phosphogluconolactonase
MEAGKGIHIFETPEAVAKAACDFIIRLAADTIRLNGRFVIALSGGSTPNKLFALLATPEYSEQIPWGKVFVCWGDERCVPMNDDRNNAHAARLLLLNNVPIPVANIFAIPVDMEPSEAALTYEQRIKELFKTGGTFDLILLGLGDDGHTASIFPGSPVIHEQEKWIKEAYMEEQKMYRITFSPVLINEARNILFLVTGKSKATIVNTVINGDTEINKYPAQLVKPLSGRLLWFLDKDAATRLEHVST